MPPLRPSRARVAVRALLAAYLVAVGAVTLGPQPADEGTLAGLRAAVAWLAERGLPVSVPGIEAAANVVMFLPYGVLAGLLFGGRRWWATLLAASATSGLIETAQRWIPTRVPTLQDWALNTLGAAVGLVVLVVVARRRSRPGDDEGRAPRGDPASRRTRMS